MREYTTVSARNQLSEVINFAAYGKERVGLTRRGKTVAYVVPVEDVEILMALEDKVDIEAGKEALARLGSGDEETVSHEEMVKKYGGKKGKGGQLRAV
jgi:prevent-host-death family protein